jgi:hypothetical protein
MFVSHIQVSPVSLENPCFFRKLPFLVVSPAYFFENPPFAQMRGKHCMFVLILDGNEFIQESEELFDLLSWKIGVVLCVFDFEGVHLRVSPAYYVGQGVEAWVTDRNSNGAKPSFLQQFYQGIFGVETSFSPPANGILVNFSHQFLFPCADFRNFAFCCSFGIISSLGLSVLISLERKSEHWFSN